MPDALTTPDAVQAQLLRPFTDLETASVDTLIGQASSFLRTASPSVDTRIAAFLADPTDPSGLDPVTVSGMLAGVIKRYLVNPKGIVSGSDTTGPYAHSESYALRSDKDRRGALEITPEDLAVLFPNRKRLRAGTIRLRAAMAPRPVGRYGPIPSVDQAVDAVITYSRNLPLDAEQIIQP